MLDWSIGVTKYDEAEVNCPQNHIQNHNHNNHNHNNSSKSVCANTMCPPIHQALSFSSCAFILYCLYVWNFHGFLLSFWYLNVICAIIFWFIDWKQSQIMVWIWVVWGFCWNVRFSPFIFIFRLSVDEFGMNEHRILGFEEIPCAFCWFFRTWASW